MSINETNNALVEKNYHPSSIKERFKCTLSVIAPALLGLVALYGALVLSGHAPFQHFSTLLTHKIGTEGLSGITVASGEVAIIGGIIASVGMARHHFNKRSPIEERVDIALDTHETVLSSPLEVKETRSDAKKLFDWFLGGIPSVEDEIVQTIQNQLEVNQYFLCNVQKGDAKQIYVTKNDLVQLRSSAQKDRMMNARKEAGIDPTPWKPPFSQPRQILMRQKTDFWNQFSDMSSPN